LMPAHQRFSLEKDFFPGLTYDNKKIFGYLYSGFFIDIGTPERYYKAKKHFMNNNR
jgi:NDP-sugar pyrophosphorylase family protein